MPVAADGEGVRLRVQVTPRAKRTALAGIVEAGGWPTLAIRLAAPPVDGAANKALIAFLAASLGIPKSAIRIISGETGRLKIVAITGLTPEAAGIWISTTLERC